MKTKNFTDNQIADKELLNKFLKKHRVYRRFYRNVKKHFRYFHGNNWLLTKSGTIKSCPEDVIATGFYWDKSPEKSECWCNVDYLWRKYLKGVI